MKSASLQRDMANCSNIQILDHSKTTKVILYAKKRTGAVMKDTSRPYNVTNKKHITEIQAKSQQIAEQSLLSCLQCLLPTKSST